MTIDVLHFLQKARKLKQTGFDALSGIVSDNGLEKANDMVDLLLDATDLGFKVDDLKTIFNTLNQNIENFDKEVNSPVLETQISTETLRVDLLAKIHAQLGLPLSTPAYFLKYKNPSYDGVEIEEFLLNLGLNPQQAYVKFSGSTFQKAIQEPYQEKYTLVTFNRATRYVYEPSTALYNVMLKTVEKFLESLKTVPSNHQTVVQWLNCKVALQFNDTQIEPLMLPEWFYFEFLEQINKSLIEKPLYQEGLYLRKDLMSDNTHFGIADSLDVSKGFCELIYRDSLIRLFSKDTDQLYSFKEFLEMSCLKRGVEQPSKELSDFVMARLNLLTVTFLGSWDLEVKITQKGLRPYHCLLVLHCIEKFFDKNRAGLTITPLF